MFKPTGSAVRLSRLFVTNFAYPPRQRWVADVKAYKEPWRISPGRPHARSRHRLTAQLNLRCRSCRPQHHGPTSDEVGIWENLRRTLCVCPVATLVHGVYSPMTGKQWTKSSSSKTSKKFTSPRAANRPSR